MRNMEIKYRPDLYRELEEIKKNTFIQYKKEPNSVALTILGALYGLSFEMQKELEEVGMEMDEKSFERRYGFKYPYKFQLINLAFSVIKLELDFKLEKISSYGLNEYELFIVKNFIAKLQSPYRNPNMRKGQNCYCFYERNLQHDFEHDLEMNLLYIEQNLDNHDIFNIPDEEE